MDTTRIPSAVLLIVAFMVLGTAKLAAVPAMRARAEHLGFTTSAYRRIGLLEALAAVGLIVGTFSTELRTTAPTLTAEVECETFAPRSGRGPN